MFKTVNKFAEIKSILINNEFDFLTKRCHKISNFYILPKLHKSKEINEIIETKRTEYIQIDKDKGIKIKMYKGILYHTSYVMYCPDILSLIFA